MLIYNERTHVPRSMSDPTASISEYRLGIQLYSPRGSDTRTISCPVRSERTARGQEIYQAYIQHRTQTQAQTATERVANEAPRRENSIVARPARDPREPPSRRAIARESGLGPPVRHAGRARAVRPCSAVLSPTCAPRCLPEAQHPHPSLPSPPRSEPSRARSEQRVRAGRRQEPLCTATAQPRGSQRAAQAPSPTLYTLLLPARAARPVRTAD